MKKDQVSPPESRSRKDQRPFPLFYLLVSLIAMTILRFALPGARIVLFPWNLLGLLPLLTGVFLNLAADKAFQRAGATVKPFQASSALITEGVFRFSRNPMYLGMALILVGVAIMLGSLTPFVVVAVFGILVHVVFISIEERMLAEKFGEAWGAYQAQVRRWL
ncbi:MAG: isoprenylcysteine carboxylmethyltransferase family protein [Vicinamibacteria bacterium]|nr:isoprenylcysteine carboxylmethyltransferase family protein [Vicinamibacteria bacterium]